MKQLLLSRDCFLIFRIFSFLACFLFSDVVFSDDILRFSFQADVHNFRRIPESYLRKMFIDSEKIGCDFLALLGDIMDSDEPNPLKLTNSVSIPVIYQHGDHELFNEWGRTGYRNYDGIPFGNEKRNDPLVFFRSSIPRYETITHLPTAWSFDYKGIHFVVCFNGKDIVWYPWFLRWLEEDLKKAKDKTIVLFSHRPLSDGGETAEVMRKIVEKYKSIRLYCYGHTHSHAEFYRIGNALCINAEANSPYNGKSYEGNWYVMVEITKDAIRIFRRVIDSSETKLLWQERIPTTLKPIHDSEAINMAFLMSDKCIRSIPAIRLKNVNLRMYNIRTAQILEQKGIILNNNVTAELRLAEEEWQKLGIGEVFKLNWKGNNTNEWCELARWEVPIYFETEPQKVGEAGTIEQGTVYMPLLLVKGRKGERVRLFTECRKSDGSLESRHWVEGNLEGGICALWSLIGHIKFNSPNNPFWRWMGVEGKAEIDDYKEPRKAVKMLLSLYAKPAEAEDFETIAFVYPNEAFFTPVHKGNWFSEDVKVTVGEKGFFAKDLSKDETTDFPLGILNGREKIALECRGSKLTLIEIKGETDGLIKCE